jgi:Sap, sulfolipid-1-addressing protein
VLEQAAGLALLAAISPTALLVSSIYLGSARPRLTMLCYLAGAIVMSAVTAIAVLIALRSGGLEFTRNRTPRYGLRLGLGLLTFAVAAVLARRRPRPPDPARPTTGIMSRLVADPKPVTALLAGLLVFAPSVTFVAAIQVVATARASVPLSAAGTVMVIAIAAAFVWLPLFAFLAWPKRTAGTLAAFNAWLRSHGRQVLLAALALAGLFLVINGLAGLLSRL